MLPSLALLYLANNQITDQGCATLAVALRGAAAPRLLLLLLLEELAADLGGDVRVRLRAEQHAQLLALLGRELGLVALREDEQRLVPQHGQRARLARERREVIGERRDDAQRERVLLREEHAHEDGARQG